MTPQEANSGGEGRRSEFQPAFALAAFPHLLEHGGHVLQPFPQLPHHVHGRVAAYGESQAVGRAGIEFDDLPLHDLVFRLKNQAGVVDLLIHADNDDTRDFRPERLHREDEEVVREWPRRKLAAQGGVDGSAHRGIDVEHDGLRPVAQENGATGLGWQEGDGFHADKIGHAGRRSRGVPIFQGERASRNSGKTPWRRFATVLPGFLSVAALRRLKKQENFLDTSLQVPLLFVNSMKTRFSPRAVCVFVLASLPLTGAESPTSDRGSDAAPVSDVSIEETFMARRKSLAREMMALVESGASPQEIETWHEANAARHQALRDAAIAMAARQTPPELPFIEEIQLPEGASRNMEEFLLQRAVLHNSRVELLNRLHQATEEERQQALETLQSQNEEALEVQRALAVQISEEGFLSEEQEIAADPNIPPDASPELEDFLTKRHALMKEQIALLNQYRSATPEARQQALEDWHENNFSRLNALRKAATDIQE